LNLGALAKLQKARQLVPFGVPWAADTLALVTALLTAKLPPKERSTFARRLEMSKPEAGAWKKLEAAVRPLERKLKAAKLQRPSLVYEALRGVPGEQILLVYVVTKDRLVHDRIRNYLTKYLPAAQEITDKEVIAAGYEPGSSRFEKVRQEMVAARLDGRIWRPEAAAARSRSGKPRSASPLRRGLPALSARPVA